MAGAERAVGPVGFSEDDIAGMLREHFEAYYAEFLEITSRARARFERREWTGVLEDAEERINLYHAHLDLGEERMRILLV